MRSVLPYLLFNRILFFVFSHIRSKRLWGNPFSLRENGSKLHRQKRYAVCRCPLSALFCTSIYSLTTRNFCITYRFVFSEGGQRCLILHSFTNSNLLALQGWQLDRNRLRRRMTPSFQNGFA